MNDANDYLWWQHGQRWACFEIGLFFWVFHHGLPTTLSKPRHWQIPDICHTLQTRAVTWSSFTRGFLGVGKCQRHDSRLQFFSLCWFWTRLRHPGEAYVGRPSKIRSVKLEGWCLSPILESGRVWLGTAARSLPRMRKRFCSPVLVLVFLAYAHTRTRTLLHAPTSTHAHAKPSDISLNLTNWKTLKLCPVKAAKWDQAGTGRR